MRASTTLSGMWTLNRGIDVPSPESRWVTSGVPSGPSTSDIESTKTVAFSLLFMLTFLRSFTCQHRKEARKEDRKAPRRTLQ